MRAIIFANGILEQPKEIRSLIGPTDLIVAADGGARHCRALGLTPQVIVGDMDSLEPDEVHGYEALGVEIVRYPARKDQTDLELALSLALDRGADDLLVLGGLGARWDMTLANVFLLARPELARATVRLIDGRQEVRLLRGGRTEIRGRAGDTLSLIPIAGPAVGVTLAGMEYPLNDDTLELGATWGVSNVLKGEQAQVEFRSGMLLCVLMRNAGEGQ